MTTNQDWVPECGMEPTAVQTYTDGTWGIHEYSRWPQLAIPNMWHVACIPTQRGNPHLPGVLWARLQPETDWIEDPTSGIPGVGMLTPDLRHALYDAAEQCVARAKRITAVPARRSAFVHELCLVVRQCVERMRRVPALQASAIALAAHIQRLCLELLGLETYLLVVLPRLEGGRDCSRDILPVVGAFVRDEATADKCVRAGLPTWCLQPFTSRNKTWRIVACTPFSSPPEGRECRAALPIAQVTNGPGNWLSSMVFAISRQLCETAYPTLQPSGDDADNNKRARLQLSSKSIHLPLGSKLRPDSMSLRRPRSPPGPTLREERVTRDDDASRHRSSLPSGTWSHPSRQYTPSPFYDVPQSWARALQSQDRLDPPPSSSVYFYPPPFLLDTWSPRAPLPDDVPYPIAAREDEKVSRYVHNLLRIREYCRIRLLDPKICGRPLSIAEWRAALWGDYDHKPIPSLRGTEGARRRAKRKHEEKCAIGELFGNGACLDSYSQAAQPLFDGQEVSAHTAAHDRRIRTLLLWEAHEINWRCELMALDQAMVPRSGWPIIDKWSREAQISAAWGLPTGVMSVIPLLPSETQVFCWRSPPDPDWPSCVQFLRAFVDILASWPTCPRYLRHMRGKGTHWSPEDFELIQSTATAFYTSCFVRTYNRLPVIPFHFPTDLRTHVYP